MKKFILTAILATSIFSVSIAQKQKKYERIIYLDAKVDANDVTIVVDNAVSTDKETKVKLKITNKTNDFIIFKPNECVFKIDGKELKPTEKELIIDPNESDFRVINLKGIGYNAVTTYSLLISGIYRVMPTASPLNATDFKLPVSQNSFKVGGFNCSVKDVYKQSDNTTVKFDVSYNGDKVGIIFPSRPAVEMPDGNEYATAKAKAKPVLLTKGKDDSFKVVWDRMEGGKTMDMQKVEMIVKWKDTFNEGTLEKLKSETLELAIDEIKSK